MNRVELKCLLRKLGVNERLMQRPAGVEPLYRETVDYTEDKVRRDKLIYFKNGTLTIARREIKLKEDGTVEILCLDTGDIIWVNEYGIEKEILCKEPKIRFRRIFGRVEEIDVMNRIVRRYHSYYLDNGEPLIKDAKKIRVRDWKGVPYDFNKDNVFAEFDKNAKEISRLYPKTAKWYEKARIDLLKQIKVEKSNETQRRAIEMLKDKIERLESSTEEHRYNINYIFKRLGVSLMFIDDIKRHPLGELLYKKELEDYKEEMKSHEAAHRIKSKKGGEDDPEEQKAIPGEDDDPKKADMERWLLEEKIEKLEEENRELEIRERKARLMFEIANTFISNLRENARGRMLFILPQFMNYQKSLNRVEEKEAQRLSFENGVKKVGFQVDDVIKRKLFIPVYEDR